MLLSAVSFLVVAQSSSEVPEGLMNNPVFFPVHFSDPADGQRFVYFSTFLQETFLPRYSVRSPLPSVTLGHR